MTSAVDHPTHYNTHPSGIECIDVVEHMGFSLGNVIKYVWRADEKGDSVEDLEKAQWYLAREIAKRRKQRDEAAGPIPEPRQEESQPELKQPQPQQESAPTADVSESDVEATDATADAVGDESETPTVSDNEKEQTGKESPGSTSSDAATPVGNDGQDDDAEDISDEVDGDDDPEPDDDFDEKPASSKTSGKTTAKKKPAKKKTPGAKSSPRAERITQADVDDDDDW